MNIYNGLATRSQKRKSASARRGRADESDMASAKRGSVFWSEFPGPCGMYANHTNHLRRVPRTLLPGLAGVRRAEYDFPPHARADRCASLHDVERLLCYASRRGRRRADPSAWELNQIDNDPSTGRGQER